MQKDTWAIVTVIVLFGLFLPSFIRMGLERLEKSVAEMQSTAGRAAASMDQVHGDLAAIGMALNRMEEALGKGLGSVNSRLEAIEGQVECLASIKRDVSSLQSDVDAIESESRRNLNDIGIAAKVAIEKLANRDWHVARIETRVNQ